MAEEENIGECEMSFLEHLEEMRGTIIRILAVFMVALVAVLVGFHYFNSLMLYPLNAAKVILAKYNSWSEEEKAPVEQKLGPVYLVMENGDGTEASRQGPFFILPKDDSVTLVKDAPEYRDPWYNDIKLRSMTFATPIVVYFYVGFLGALGISLPFAFYFIARFIAPGLTREERRILRPAIITSIFLFFFGAAFAFCFMLPMGIAFMSWMSQGMQMEMFPDAQSYYSMVIFLTIAVGIVFELPLLQTILIYLGVLDVNWLRKNRRTVFLVILIFATIVTPPDFITQLSLTFPLYFMYEISLRIGERMRKRKLEREEREAKEAEEQYARERREYAQIIAKERIAEEEAEHKEAEQAKSKFEIDTSHYTPPTPTKDEGDGYDPTNPASAQHYGYKQYEDYLREQSAPKAVDNTGEDDDFDEDDYQLQSYINYGRLARPTPNFSPNWDLNKPDTSFMAPNWELNSTGEDAEEKGEDPKKE